MRPGSPLPLGTAKKWLTEPTAQLTALFFTLAGVTFFFLPHGVLSRIGPPFLVLQLVVITIGRRRRPLHDVVIWRMFHLGLLFQIGAFVGYLRIEEGSRTPLWTAVQASFGTLALVCFGLAGITILRPLLHLPSTSRPARLAAVGSVLTLASTQWLDAGAPPTGNLGLVIRGIVVLSVGSLLASRLYLHHPLLALGRNVDLMLVSACCVFGIGQVVAFVAFGPHPPLRAFSYMPLTAGLIAAASLRSGMTRLGQPLNEVSDRPLTIVTPIVMLAVFGVDALLVTFLRGANSTPTVVVVISVIAAAQLVGLVWLSGTLMTMPGRRATLRETRVRREFRSALSRGEIDAHFQPIVQSGDFAIAGFETLARWPHPRYGALPTARLQLLATASGCQVSLDRQMIRRAVEALPELRTWTTVVAPFVTVPVASHRLQERGFADQILTEFRTANLDPKGLVLEIAETAADVDWVALRANVTVLQRAGIGLSIDDFGAGETNLGFLVSVDPDLVKVNHLLVVAAVHSQRGRDVATKVIQAARLAGGRTVAKGVADPEWLALLREMDFDLLQGESIGPLVSRPDGWSDQLSA
jgi:EAL domain-containing protein (putative c-di-GMP-specific phosphodiesterase class I)